MSETWFVWWMTDTKRTNIVGELADQEEQPVGWSEAVCLFADDTVAGGKGTSDSGRSMKCVC